MNYKKLIEWLGEKEHEQWQHWTMYFLENINGDNLDRWARQVRTPYKKLSRDEKESDERWAVRIIDEMPFKCPIWQCGGIMKTKERPLPNSGPLEYDGDFQSPDLVCTNCKAVYQFKGFTHKRGFTHK